ncbi:MAG: glutamate 5-kinase [Oscillospiraceae bacterium]
MAKISEKKRIVIKVGSSTLTHATGMINIRRIEQLVKVIADLKNNGKEIVFVSSGAQAVGMGKLALKEKPQDMPTKQAIAAIGQCELMYLYDKQFSMYNHVVAQVLLTKDGIIEKERRQNVINTLSRLVDIGTIPIINENDTVSVEEIEFGDNDTLSAIVGELVGADLLIILSDINGLYDDDPHKNPNAKLIPTVEKIDDKIFSLAGSAGSKLGTGGMITKIHAAQIANAAGIDMVIMNGSNPAALYDLFEDKAVGTIFKAK